MVILIDNGHGNDTAGKRSPDGRLREYAWTREIAQRIVDRLISQGHIAERVVTEETDVPLSERCRRVNRICKLHGGDNVILISVHCNAAGNGCHWLAARGWEAWTTHGRTKSDILAEFLYEEAKIKGLTIRRDMSDGDADKEGHLYILKNTACLAVLTENLFQDNKEDVAYLLSEAGKEAIVDLHVNGISNFLKSKSR